ncbi:butyrophilin subfamily 1 member A1-like [Sebastes umbrosus]|uniref:butyrophilin subfamily 1 member A1-like n=1 Tax=Sebastes umbrosus TaxID=72105 RepID=UPI00189DE07B|nr:butyrophilin subfamily 1 member A1-like [Sebastes umbrosus]
MTSSPSLILFVVFLFHKLDTVSCQMKVQASVGHAVLLPCIYSKPDRLQDSVPVFWRDRNDNIVLNIRDKAPDLSTQSAEFKGRVVWKEEQYSRGNFSIVMKDVQKADSGPYECHIPSLSFEHRVTLNVSDRVESSRGITAVTPTSFLMVLLPPLLSLIYM